ncbi:MAG: ABC transporter permease [Candidatus Bipolaricaulota bacterium]|nr:ABC transporter permease [Candidatus Bipolaricaulota bacterium]MCS7274127.1 ABC transporter permease [Candidatus Bipolaricaulota bacterium]MDW8111300.1 ABC transporter permease [Candidatus Bipolaricaulota bacterium]MDW8328564.1 ABC transporter permease [Candidatus Bipolaricaulota bacterium]
MEERSFLRIFLASGPGRIGLVFLGVIIAISVYVLTQYPLDYGLKVWNNPALWADYPKEAPPIWIRLFGVNAVPHTILELRTPTQRDPNGSLYTVGLEWGDLPPRFISLTLGKIDFHRERPPVITLSLRRPDGKEIRLFQHSPLRPQANESPPYVRYEVPRRFALSADTTVQSVVASWLRSEFNLSITASALRDHVPAALFGTPVSDREFRPLPGRYELRVRVDTPDPRDTLEKLTVVLGGSAYGLMGTDTIGRDLAQGLLFGFPVALFIGLFVSIITTFVGAALGILSGYLGGWVDAFIQRFTDIVVSVPTLPLLIFLVVLLGSNLFYIMLFIAAFGWTGLTIVIRPMVLQLREGQLIEAEKSLGASRWRIMARHIFPQLGPYIFAQLIFFTPSAILTEAGLSFLGLGDPSLPTWGQILERGFRTGAVYLGYWWWVLPPGLLIVFTAVTFLLLALALEPIVNPRLRRM